MEMDRLDREQLKQNDYLAFLDHLAFNEAESFIQELVLATVKELTLNQK
jgi:hypothetical protein